MTVSGLGVTTFWAFSCPTPIRFRLVMYFKGYDDEFTTGERYPVTIVFSRPDGRLDDFDFEYEPDGPPDGCEPGWETSVIEEHGFQFTAESFGAYGLDMFFEGERYKDSPYLLVRQGMPPGFSD